MNAATKRLHASTRQLERSSSPLPTSGMAYSYSADGLVKSYEALKDREEIGGTGGGRRSGGGNAAAGRPPTSGSKINNNANNQQYCNNKNKQTFKVSAIQISANGLSNSDVEGFWKIAQQAVEKAAAVPASTTPKGGGGGDGGGGTGTNSVGGADLILLPEFFIGPYFCQSQEDRLMSLAEEISENHFIIRRMKQLAIKHNVVLPISFFERKNNALYNSVAMIDADGTLLGTYRKSHIPDGTGYQEKFYFTPGDTGFKVFETKIGKVGVGICWDQWFPEAARAMALQGADILLYPTAIGSEPQDPTMDTSDHWQRVMQGHAAANMIPVVAANRHGTEILLHDYGLEKQRITFYGRSFITNETGEIVQEVKEQKGESYVILSATINPIENRSKRLAWGIFRDRRPGLYGILQTKDGVTPSNG